MSALLWTLAAALALPLTVAIAALATPICLSCAIDSAPHWRLTVAARLFWGVTPPIRILDSARRHRPARRRRKPTPARSGRSPRGLAAGLRLMMDLLRAIRLRRLTLDADVGLADPADTGRLFGLIAALAHSRPPSATVSIEIRPDFTRPRASGRLAAELSFVPLAFAPPGLRFVWRVFGPNS